MGRLRVDLTACDGIGQCALVAPDLVTLDRWGYPVLHAPLDAAAGGGKEDDSARRAVRACPRRALWLE